MSEVQRMNEEKPTQISREEFYAAFGGEIDFKKRIFNKYWDLAEAQYKDLPYHNFNHAVQTLWTTMELAEVCEANEVYPDKKVLVGASLFHDAGYFHETPAEPGAKERHAVELFYESEGDKHFKPEQLSKVAQAIMATSFDHRPVSIEDKILVRADIDNIGDDYAKFKESTSKLWEERKLLLGESFSEKQFIGDSLKILSSYVSHELSLGEFETSNWRRQALSNLRHLATEMAVSEGLSLSSYIRSLGSTAVSKVIGRDNG